MGFLSGLFGGAAAAPIDAIGNVLDKLFTSDEEKLDKKIMLQRLQQRPHELQVELNKIEAQHRSVFVAGWRPAIGWVCALGLANTFLINPWIQWVSGKTGPTLPSNIMLELVISLLGLGALRTFEKMKGVSK